jgi:hypothetical protein
MGAGFFLVIVGLLADLTAVNRALLEGVDWRLQRVEERLTNRDESRVIDDPLDSPSRTHRSVK